MPAPQRVLFECGGATSTVLRADSDRIETLSWRGESPNLALEALDRTLVEQFPDAAQDLLQIAACVYAADRLVSRGGVDVNGERWVRIIGLAIPVRDAVWHQPEVGDLLVGVLGFLTEDQWRFEFLKDTEPRPARQAALFEDDTFRGRSCVALFSGGLDSLAGAIWDIEQNAHHPILVSHSSTDVFGARQRTLVQRLGTGLYPHIPTKINLQRARAVEHTQRSRSFLYLAVGAVLASQFGLDAIHVFENGVLSINLPLAGQVVGARASRTTHPRFIADMEGLLRRVLRPTLTIDLPFFERTKSELVRLIVDAGRADLIGQTVSCTHVVGRSRHHPHCGVCSQCIDRRFAVSHAGQMGLDDTYEHDLFVGSMATFPDEAEARSLIEGYCRTYRKAGELSIEALLIEYPEIDDLVGNVPDAVLSRLPDLFERQAVVVKQVLAAEVRAHADEFVDGTLPEDCALRLLVGTGALSREPLGRYADKITEIGRRCLPVAFRKVAAKRETDVHRELNAGLAAAKVALDAEFPMYSHVIGVGTKPDFSDERRGLFIEVKFPRSTRPLATIVGEIDGAITRYRRRVPGTLFLVWDPERLVQDDDRFREEVERNGPGIFCRVLR